MKPTLIKQLGPDRQFPNYLNRIIKDSIRLYFAPLVGTFKGIRAEYRRIAFEKRRVGHASQNEDTDQELEVRRF